jgi:hypothetical protein
MGLSRSLVKTALNGNETELEGAPEMRPFLFSTVLARGGREVEPLLRGQTL